MALISERTKKDKRKNISVAQIRNILNLPGPLILLFALNCLIFTFVFFSASYSLTIKPGKNFVFTSPQSLSGKLSISGAWALYPLAARWVEEFQKENPSVKIDLQAGGAGKGIADVLAGLVDIGMVSRAVYPEELSRGAIPIAVARDAVVATFNQKNPIIKTILEKGLSVEIFRAIWIEGRIKYWEEIYGLPGKTPIHLYTRSDACGAAETWAAFLGAHQEDLKGIAIYGDPGLAEAVRRDPLGIGFNNLNFAYNPQTGKPHHGLAICPFDLNHNGRLDPEENFYSNRDQLISAISSGLYPSPPARDLYLVVKKPLSNPLIRAFLGWVLDRGQKLVEETGYVALDKRVIEAEKQKLF
ncbi:MAG: substrate-binding domain-containing protein [Candidatus Aminicenantes bacterium]|nr:substrate-binding domain-containing protein [Candidatus Aminicenantes bacterium]